MSHSTWINSSKWRGGIKNKTDIIVHKNNLIICFHKVIFYFKMSSAEYEFIKLVSSINDRKGSYLSHKDYIMFDIPFLGIIIYNYTRI